MLSFLKTKKILIKPFSPSIEKRVSKISTPDLEVWADQAISEIGRCLTLYSRSKEQVYLDELLKGAEALHAVADAMHRRLTKVL